MTEQTPMADFIKAQSEMKAATLNKINPHFKSKYADLTSVIDATLPHLNKNNLGIQQTMAATESGMLLTTRMIHACGVTVQESQWLLPTGLTAQKMGSEITYARRYTWSAICGISADEDDDANGAEKSRPPTKDAWQGPMNKTALMQVMRDLAGELDQISSKDTEGYVLGIWSDNKAVLAQAKIDLPVWYDRVLPIKDKALKAVTTFPGDDPFGLPPIDGPEE